MKQESGRSTDKSVTVPCSYQNTGIPPKNDAHMVRKVGGGPLVPKTFSLKLRQ